MKKRIVLENRLNEIKKLFAALEDFRKENDLPRTITDDLKLCLEEVVSNIIKYGYKDSGSHKIIIEMELKRDSLLLSITDDAAEFNPLEYPLPDLSRPVEERDTGGLGIHIIRRLMDSIEYKRQDNKNILFLSKNIKNI